MASSLSFSASPSGRPLLPCPFLRSRFLSRRAMAPRRRRAWPAAAVFVAAVVAVGFAAEAADMVQERLTVGMTIVAGAASTGAGKSTFLRSRGDWRCECVLACDVIRRAPFLFRYRARSVPRREPAGVPPAPRLRRRRAQLAAPVRGRRLVQRRAVVRRQGRDAPGVHPPHDQGRGLLRHPQQPPVHESRYKSPIFSLQNFRLPSPGAPCIHIWM